MSKFICFHGHFYQPPRENPWTQKIDEQPSAHPYHDWNERINAECYGALAKLNVYEKISFNFGPTLLSWMAQHAADVYERIIRADKVSLLRFDGCGNAMAQAYNHMILPLSNERDKQTQVVWGIRDFEHRFGRTPLGMWLPETAVNVDTLEVLARHELKFTVLAPKQASRIRKIGDTKWEDVHHGSIETKRLYECRLPSGKSIIIFFYDAHISSKLAFGPYTRSIIRFEHGLEHEIDRDFDEDAIIHGAVDGETYGHHQKKGHLVLNEVLHGLKVRDDVALTNYEYFFMHHPPTYEVEIFENTAWSCESGLNRWFMDDRHSYDASTRRVHKWREVLRNSLDWLRERLIEVYEKEMMAICRDPWALRDEYVRYLLTKDASIIETKLSDAGSLPKALKLLEMQKMAMFMYTSCGWFFEDISRIETVQILRYAARAIQHGRELSGLDFMPEFLGSLENAISKDPRIENGKRLFLEQVMPLMKGASA